MKNWLLFAFLINSLAANSNEEAQVFRLIQANVVNLKDRGASNDSANELIHLIEEGYRIDPLNMSTLIETLILRDASDNATRVILKAIEYNSPITENHFACLIETLNYPDVSSNARKVILKAIEYGFSPKEIVREIDGDSLIWGLIENLKNRSASNDSANELIHLIEEGYGISSVNMTKLIETLNLADASNNAAEVILKAIAYGAKFTPKERLLLAEVSKVANAKKNVERIRKALHERQMNSGSS